MAPPTPLHAYLTEQTGLVLEGLDELRDGADPIHDTRVAIRRVRSTVRVFGTVLDDQAHAVEQELKWFAGMLGDVRDVQVQRERLRSALGELPDELVLGRVADRVKRDLRRMEAPARDRVAEAMATPRYQDLVAELRRWSDAPPVRAKVTAKQLQKKAHRAAAKADRRLAKALDSVDDALLHRARKAAKRARYAAELIQAGAPSTKATRKQKHYKKIQSVLGDLQDTVVARSMLRQMGAGAGSRAKENGFTFGLLYAREEQLALRCRRDVARL